MARRAAPNQVAAGAFIVLMLAAAFISVVLVGGWESYFTEMQAVRMQFRSAPNLKVGSPVALAGHPVGRVEQTELVEVECEPDDKMPGGCYRVEVLTHVPTQYTLHKDAVAVIVQSLVGQSASINIVDVGTGDPLGPNDILVGMQASAFAAAAGELGIGDKEKKSIAEIIEDVKTSAANLADITAKAKTTLQTIQEVLDENRPKIKKTFDHASSLAEKADTGVDDILPNIKAASADLKTAVADLRHVTADGKTVLAHNKSNLNQTLQNFRDTSEHLKALAKEVRRAPWRLFARPDKKEVESLNLYDAARAFASAATDLEGLADTLQAMVDAKAEGVEVDPEVLQGMIERLEETFGRYQEAEDALWKEFERISK